MARSAQVDPFEKLRFTVELEGLDGAPVTRAGFMTCSLPSESNGEILYREGNYRDSHEKSPGLTVYSDISLSRGVTTDQDFYAWVSKQKAHSATVRPSGDAAYTANDARPSDDSSNLFRRTVRITLLDREGVAVKRWTCYNCHVSEFVPGDGLDSNAEEKVMSSVTLRIEGYDEEVLV
jgi:phage tail-like protein